MSLTTSSPIDHCKVSRKLTVNIHHHTPNVRPIIKGAFEEASNSLTEAYLNDNIMGWCVQGLEQKRHHEFLYTLFKHMINVSSLQSRDFALQVEGCKGILIWTNKPNSSPWPRVLSTVKLARLIGWAAAIRTVTKVGPSCDKLKRKIMADHPQYITIGHVGVLPQEQHKGYGSALVHSVLDKADNAKHPIYVEVSDPVSVKFFEQFGFKVQDTVFIANRPELPVSIMVRLPAVSGTPERLHIRPGRRDSDNSF